MDEIRIPKPPRDLGVDQTMTHAAMREWLTDPDGANCATEVAHYRSLLARRIISKDMVPHSAITQLDQQRADLEASLWLLDTLVHGFAKCWPDPNGRAEALIKGHAAELTEAGDALTALVGGQLYVLEQAHRAKERTEPGKPYIDTSLDSEKTTGQVLAQLRLLQQDLSSIHRYHYVATTNQTARVDPLYDGLQEFCRDRLVPRIYELTQLVGMQTVALPRFWPQFDGKQQPWQVMGMSKDASHQARLMPPERKPGFQMTANEVTAALTEHPGVASLMAAREARRGKA